MMKSKKIMVVFILTVLFLLVMVTCPKADDVGQLPQISVNNNPSLNTSTVDNNTSNNQNAPVIGNTNTNDTLPQTGVAGDTVLFVFITVCIVSAAYAYFRIKKYNNLH